MSDNRPGGLRGKQRLIAPFAIALLVVLVGGGALLVQAVRHRPTATPTQPPPAAPAPAPQPSAAPPLSREDLLRDANALAAAFAESGRQAPAGADPILGRRFALAIAFGCDGPGVGPPGAQESVEYDPEKQTLRLSVRRADWRTLPLVQDLPQATDIEAVEGFWIPHPWVYAEGCPVRREQPEPATPTPPAAPTLGFAEVFRKGDSRLPQRGDRPYAVVRRVTADDQALLSHAYRLRLQGRIVGFKDGRALHCWSESPDHQPVCLFGVAFDRVAIEDAASGQVLGEWLE